MWSGTDSSSDRPDKLSCSSLGGSDSGSLWTCFLKTGLVGDASDDTSSPEVSRLFLVEEGFEPNVRDDGERAAPSSTRAVAINEDGEDDLTNNIFMLFFFAGRRAWKTCGGSAAGAGVTVRLWVMNTGAVVVVDAVVVTGLIVTWGGEFDQSIMGQGAICRSTIFAPALALKEEEVWGTDLSRVCAYGR